MMQKFLSSILGADANGNLPGVAIVAELFQWRDRHTGEVRKGFRHYHVETAADAARTTRTISERGADAYVALAQYESFNSDPKARNRTRENAAGARSFWLDIDCGPDKRYPDQAAGLLALRKFCEVVGLPKPTHIVNSGNGFHVYWRFDEFIPTAKWIERASQLKRLAEKHGFDADPARTADITSVLRVPETMNFKDPAKPKLVTVLHAGTAADLPSFTRALDAATAEHNANSAIANPKRLEVPSQETPKNIALYKSELPTFPIETMGAMLEYLTNRDFFANRSGVEKDIRGRITKLGWLECGMALKLAYGDPGLDLWAITHIDDRARHDASAQWASFANESHPGHVTVATIIKAAKDAGFTARANGSISSGGYLSHGAFTMDPDEGLIKRVSIGRGKEKQIEEVWISAPFEVLAHCRDPLGRAWGKEIRFRDGDSRVHLVHVSDAKLQGDPAALCASLAEEGLRIERSRQRDFAEYLSRVAVSSRATMVSRTGWVELDGRTVFVLPTQTLGEPNGQAVVLDAVAHGPYEVRGSLEDWKQGVGRLSTGHKLPILMISTALAGPLAYLLGEEGGGIHLYGPSSTGKSTVLRAGASVWGRGDTPGYVRSWRSTANGLEGAAASSTDTCLFLDELGVGEAREVSLSIYQLSNGIGKTRSARDGSLREPKSWRVLVASSGELPIEAKLNEDRGRKVRGGQTVRFVDVHADRGLGFGVFDHSGSYDDAGKLADALKEAARSSYGKAGPAFVAQLLAKGTDEILARAKRFIPSFVGTAIPEGASEQMARATKKFALIAFAGELATSFGIAPWQKGEASRAAIWALNRWIERRGGAGSHEERQAVEQVRLLIEQNGEARFENADGNGPAVRDRLGWRHGQGSAREWWIPSETWKAELCDGLDPTFVARTLEAKGMLRRQDRKRLQRLVTVDQRKVRVYVLTASILESI